MGLAKYKYYFRKPRLAIAKDILSWLAIGGMILIAGQSPRFGTAVIKAFKRWEKRRQRYQDQTIYNAFYRLRRQGCIEAVYQNHQLYISLTAKGKERANWYQIDSLEIVRPQRWDGKWRVVIFDISQPQLTKREAFRGKLKELGFYQLQKSVWVYPFDCRSEIELLRDFFGLRKKDIRLILAENIEDDEAVRKAFRLG